MGCLAFLALVLTVVAGGQRSRPDCPCIDPQLLAAQKETIDVQDCLVVTHGARHYCYPTDYGASQCKAWDQGLAPYCDDAASTTNFFCQDQWCFVDPSQCSLTYVQSKAFPGSFISYETCGSENRHEKYQVETMLKNVNIRVAFPLDWHPYHFQTNASRGIQRPDGQWVDGANIRLFVDIAAAAGFNYTVVPIAPLSLEKYPLSSFTACVHTIAMGLADMCVSSFWVTAQRLAMSSFTTLIWADDMILVTMRAKEESFWDMAAKVFTPFTTTLWIAILLVSLFLGGLIWLNEWGRSGVKVDSAIYYSLSAFCQTPYLEDGSINSRSVRLQDRVLMLALGWFVMISLATYTAELASFLTARKVTIAIGDFQALKVSREHLCLIDAIHDQVISQDPSLESLIKVYDTYGACLDALRAGECGAALVSKAEAPAFKGDDGDECPYTSSMITMATLPIAFPTAQSLVHPVMYWQRHTLDKQPWATYLAPFVSADVCDLTDLEGESLATTVQQMLGMWLMLAGLLAVWFALWAWNVIPVLRARCRGRGAGGPTDPQPLEESCRDATPAPAACSELSASDFGWHDCAGESEVQRCNTAQTATLDVPPRTPLSGPMPSPRGHAVPAARQGSGQAAVTWKEETNGNLVGVYQDVNL